MAEAKFEAALISKLEAEGWTYRKDFSNVSIKHLNSGVCIDSEKKSRGV